MRISDWSSDVCSSDLALDTDRAGQFCPRLLGRVVGQGSCAAGRVPAEDGKADDERRNDAAGEAPEGEALRRLKFLPAFCHGCHGYSPYSRVMDRRLPTRLDSLAAWANSFFWKLPVPVTKKDCWGASDCKIGRASCRERGWKYV